MGARAAVCSLLLSFLRRPALALPRCRVDVAGRRLFSNRPSCRRRPGRGRGNENSGTTTGVGNEARNVAVNGEAGRSGKGDETGGGPYRDARTYCVRASSTTISCPGV
ncbi:hypothetical protein DFH06DRAFT_573377 [Mycena polygramma]|nr:hypothetical protein DFH06DRAFT_573377 [Mycena polygramma]